MIIEKTHVIKISRKELSDILQAHLETIVAEDWIAYEQTHGGGISITFKDAGPYNIVRIETGKDEKR